MISRVKVIKNKKKEINLWRVAWSMN